MVVHFGVMVDNLMVIVWGIENDDLIEMGVLCDSVEWLRVDVVV